MGWAGKIWFCLEGSKSSQNPCTRIALSVGLFVTKFRPHHGFMHLAYRHVSGSCIMHASRWSEDACIIRASVHHRWSEDTCIIHAKMHHGYTHRGYMYQGYMHESNGLSGQRA